MKTQFLIPMLFLLSTVAEASPIVNAVPSANTFAPSSSVWWPLVVNGVDIDDALTTTITLNLSPTQQNEINEMHARINALNRLFLGLFGFGIMSFFLLCWLAIKSTYMRHDLEAFKRQVNPPQDEPMRERGFPEHREMAAPVIKTDSFSWIVGALIGFGIATLVCKTVLMFLK
ncbi:MAG: hypothetical protein V4550_18210 [Gemmatimonadota bacterium]